jgi:hypothetical protein
MVRGQGWHLAAWWSIAIGAVVLAACGGSGGDSRPPIAVVTSTVSSPTPFVAARSDPGSTVSAVVQACREKDAERLRALVPASVSGDEIARMLAGGRDVQLLSQSVPDAGGDSVSIDVSLRVTNDRGAIVVQRTWDLERGADRVWRLTELPKCF